MQSTATHSQTAAICQIRHLRFEVYDEVDRLLDLGENLNRCAALEVAAIGRQFQSILGREDAATT